MKTAWHWLVMAMAAVAAIFGASWAKKKIEARGSEKEHARQTALADATEKALAEKDAEIDREAGPALEAIRKKRAKIRAETKAELDRSPTQDEVLRMIEESKE